MRSVLVCAVIAGSLAMHAAPASANDRACKADDHRGGDISEAIVGFEQVGAASAESKQRFFFNFFISRPVPGLFPGENDCRVWDGTEPFDDSKKSAYDNGRFGPRPRWWGNVRVASYPQQIDTPVAQFIQNFSTEVGQLPVNKLAQSAEFVTGLEVRMTTFRNALASNDQAERERFVLSWFFGGGATGPLEPSQTLRVFAVPDKTSPDFARFMSTYPKAVNSQFVGFVSPDRDRFYRQYSTGFRLTTFYEDGDGHPYHAAPAMVSVSVGQNEQITGGILRGVVGRFEAFYPLVLWGDRETRGSGIFYLFGSALLRLGGAVQADPFVLQPSDVPGYDPRVAIVTERSNRDMYMVGVGIDVTQLVKKMHP